MLIVTLYQKLKYSFRECKSSLLRMVLLSYGERFNFKMLQDDKLIHFDLSHQIHRKKVYFDLDSASSHDFNLTLLIRFLPTLKR